MQNFKSYSLSYSSAPVEVRELFALNEEESRSLLQKLKGFDVSELLIISTCNRTEFYLNSVSIGLDEILTFIGLEKGVANPKSYAHYFTSCKNKALAINQLYRVCIGLESQVVGDMQIINQVKQAYQISADMDLAGPFLHRLMHSIFYTNKKVVQETAFRDGAASVSYATTELVEDLLSEMSDPKILVLGIGEVGQDVCRTLSDREITNVTIINRSLVKARSLAEECGYKTLPIADLERAMQESDIIISSVRNAEPIIINEMIENIQMNSHKYFIDLSVPRSIEQSIDEIPAVVLYNIDHINSKTTEALSMRMAAIPRVEQIIDQSIDEFKNWTKEMEVSPTINKLKGALEQIRKDEIARHLKTLSSKESDAVEKVTKGIMQKIIKLPVLQLKAACKRGEAEALIDTLTDLFDLEQKNEIQKNNE